MKVQTKSINIIQTKSLIAIYFYTGISITMKAARFSISLQFAIQSKNGESPINYT